MAHLHGTLACPWEDRQTDTQVTIVCLSRWLVSVHYPFLKELPENSELINVFLRCGGHSGQQQPHDKHEALYQRQNLHSSNSNKAAKSYPTPGLHTAYTWPEVRLGKVKNYKAKVQAWPRSSDLFWKWGTPSFSELKCSPRPSLLLFFSDKTVITITSVTQE